MKTPFYTLIYFLLWTSISACQHKPASIVTAAGYFPKGVSGEAINDPETRTLIYKLKNGSDSIYYFNKDPYLVPSIDTLFMESIYKRKRKAGTVVMVNGYNPPDLDEFRPESTFVEKVEYKSFLEKPPVFLSIRIFKKRFPVPESDYDKYYSKAAFLAFEDTCSYTTVLKVQDKKEK